MTKPALNPEPLLTVLAQVPPGSVIAFGAYLTLLGRIGAHKAGYAMVMFPVVALILSILFEGLELDLTIILGTLLVLTGNIFVLETRKSSAS